MLVDRSPRRFADVRALRTASAALRRRRGTSHIASTAMRADILLVPARRSQNTIGTSRTLKPASSALYVTSIWNT